MEYLSTLFVLVVLFLVVLNLYKIYKKVKERIVNTDDLVLFVLVEVRNLFEKLINVTESSMDYDYLKLTMIEELYEVIQNSSLTENIKKLASYENISLLLEPSLKYLYEKELGVKNSRIYTIADYKYSENEELELIEKETRFIYDHVVNKSK